MFWGKIWLDTQLKPDNAPLIRPVFTIIFQIELSSFPIRKDRCTNLPPYVYNGF